MPVIDVQVHAYDRNHPGRPWAGQIAGPASVTGDEMVGAMDDVGVDGALLVSPFSPLPIRCELCARSLMPLIRAGSASSSRLIQQTHRSGNTIVVWAATKGTVGIRIMLSGGSVARSRRPRYQPGSCRGRCAFIAGGPHARGDASIKPRGLAARNPYTVLVIDHLGLQQPFQPPPPAQPWADLPKGC